MQKAYIILAHKNLEHVYRLVDRLDDGNSWFYIHVDLKAKLPNTYSLLAKRKRVVLLKRLATSWGGFSLAQATLNALYEIKSSGKIFDAISLLSGQDYPIKTNKEIDQFLSDSEYSVFMEYFTLPNYRRWETGGTYRYQKYFFGIDRLSLIFSKTMNLLSTYFPAFERKLPPNLIPYCGSQWWTIDMYALNYIINFIDERPDYVEFHKFTFAPDELFFQIILLNSNDPKLRHSICKDNLRYIHWENFADAHPEILTPKDFGHLMQTHALFARKFNGDSHEEILGMIDEYLLQKLSCNH